MKPLVTVLMATYNDARYLHRCIRSVLGQTYSRFQFVIVDDASTDSTGRIARSFNDSRIRYFRMRRNVGKGRAMNYGLRQASGKYVLELDGDDWLPIYALAVLVKAMERSRPSVGLIYTDKRRWFLSGGKWVRGSIYKAPPFRNREAWALGFGTYGARFYRTSALRKIHGWPVNDPSGGRLYEDYAVMLKLLDYYQFSYLPRILYHVRARPGSTSRKQTRRFWKRSVYSMARNAFRRWGVLNKYRYLPGTYKIIKKK